MPSVSQKQHNLMAMVANDPAAAKRLGIPQKVGKEFTAADKGRTFKEGGAMDKKDLAQDKAMIKKAIKMHDAQEHKGSKGTNLAKLKKGGMATTKMGAVKTAAPSRDGVAQKGHTKGKQIVMKRGGKC